MISGRGEAEQRPRFDSGVPAARRGSTTVIQLRRPGPIISAERASAYPELDCLRDRFPAALLVRAERRAAALGVGADRVLIGAGLIAEEDYLRAMARSCRIAFDSLAHVRRQDCAVDDGQLLASAAAGILPLRIGDIVVYVVAPRGIAARTIVRLIAAAPHLRARIRLTSVECLHRFIARHGAHAIAEHATCSLQHASPMLSAAPEAWRPSLLRRAIGLGLAAMAVVAAPAAAISCAEVALSVLFLASILLRLAGILVRHRPSPPLAITDADLPVYSVIVALYGEAASVADLVESIRALDYPPEKLDAKLVVEADDRETRAAIDRLALDPRFEVIVAPPAGPRTKPKALNSALPFAHGSFVVVYDAEDRPEPGQLRAALAAFLAGDRPPCCVQAALTIDNTADGWLAAVFTAEYAGQFDAFLPSLAALGLPLPLGGSSNHFHTATLRELGAWDPYNVTEDADLGMRLSRLGHRATAIASTTYEEAPAHIKPWLRQRTRWLKGWMQTWLVHMRAPRSLLRDLGGAGFVVFQLVLAGNIAAALIYPWFVALLAWRLALGEPLYDGRLAGLYAASFFGGLIATVCIGVIGLARRGLLATAWTVVLAPLHWFLLSVAAWRAFVQLLRDPYRWEKTEHGLGRTSRRSAAAKRRTPPRPQSLTRQ